MTYPGGPLWKPDPERPPVERLCSDAAGRSWTFRTLRREGAHDVVEALTMRDLRDVRVELRLPRGWQQLEGDELVRRAQAAGVKRGG